MLLRNINQFLGLFNEIKLIIEDFKNNITATNHCFRKSYENVYIPRMNMISSDQGIIPLKFQKKKNSNYNLLCYDN